MIENIDSNYKPTHSFGADFTLVCNGKVLSKRVGLRLQAKKSKGRETYICPYCKRRMKLPCDKDILAFKKDITNVDKFFDLVNQMNGHYLNPNIETITILKG